MNEQKTEKDFWIRVKPMLIYVWVIGIFTGIGIGLFISFFIAIF